MIWGARCSWRWGLGAGEREREARERERETRGHERAALHPPHKQPGVVGYVMKSPSVGGLVRFAHSTQRLRRPPTPPSVASACFAGLGLRPRRRPASQADEALRWTRRAPPARLEVRRTETPPRGEGLRSRRGERRSRESRTPRRLDHAPPTWPGVWPRAAPRLHKGLIPSCLSPAPLSPLPLASLPLPNPTHTPNHTGLPI